MNALPQQSDTPTILLEEWAHWRLCIERSQTAHSNTGSNLLAKMGESSGKSIPGSRILWYGSTGQQFARFDSYLTDIMGKKHSKTVAIIYGCNGREADKAASLNISRMTLFRLKIKAWQAADQYVMNEDSQQ